MFKDCHIFQILEGHLHHHTRSVAGNFLIEAIVHQMYSSE